MNKLNSLLRKFNKYQQRHTLTAFVVAVVKKYGDDKAGREAALLTYYGFLSIFPLLLLLTTITDTVIGNDPHLRSTIIKGLTGYFPLLGSQLSSHVHRLHAGGLALFTGVLFLFYGTRGVADSFRHGVQHIWLIPQDIRDTFPKSMFKSLCLIIVGGAGFLLASVIASLTSTAFHGIPVKLLSLIINLLILFWLFRFLLNFSLPRHITLKETQLGAAVAAIGLVVLQSVGGYILSHELKRLDALYSYFALALGLLFWIYLQTNVLYYAVEIAIVRSQGLWPRSLDSNQPTNADKRLSGISVN